MDTAESTLHLMPEDAVRLGLFWASIAIKPEDAVRLAYGGGLDLTSAAMVIRAYGAEWNRTKLSSACH
ncbi:MAG: hypothetical protein J0H53_25845 [Rhizobiales bacterium]|nr:hypothetical protein [Hyphomicrobiales bacterium]